MINKEGTTGAGASSQREIGAAVIGGMLTGTLLTLRLRKWCNNTFMRRRIFTFSAC
jgi:multidrug efflux pump subunit AcrB